MGNCGSQYVIVRKGERYAFTNRNGEISIRDGPCRIKLEDEMRSSQLHRVHADAHEYLQIKKLDGTTSHVPGPTSLFLDVGVSKTKQILVFFFIGFFFFLSL